MSLPIPTGSSNIDPNDASLVEYTSVAATPPSHGSTFLPPLGVLPPHHPGVPIPTTSPVPIPGCSTGTDRWYKIVHFYILHTVMHEFYWKNRRGKIFR